MDGKGKLTVTGKLGDVMQESAQAGIWLLLRSRAHHLGLPRDFYRNLDVHSAHSGRGDPGRMVRPGWHHDGDHNRQRSDEDSRSRRYRDDRAKSGAARQGAAHRRSEGKARWPRIATVHVNEAIVPKDNQKDLPDIPEYLRKVMHLHFVDHMDEVLKIALERELIALPMQPGAGIEIAAQPRDRSLPIRDRISGSVAASVPTFGRQRLFASLEALHVYRTGKPCP